MKEKKKFNFGKTAFTVVFFLICFTAGIISGTIFNKNPNLDDNPLYFIVLALIFLSVYFVQVTLHETGHLVFGLVTGYKFLSFRIGDLMILKADGKIKIKKHSVAGTMGQCLLAPPEMNNGKIPYIAYNLGGVILNFLFSLAALIVFLKIKPEGWVYSMMIAFIYSGFATVILNGIPFNNELVTNDGYNALVTGRSEQALRSFYYQLKINEALSRGLRVKDMPSEWFALPSEEDKNNIMASSGAVFYCNRLMDECDFEKAEKYMETFLNDGTSMIGVHRNLMICDLIYCKAISGKAEEAQALFNKKQKKFMNSMKKIPSVSRTEYVLALLCDEDRSKAEKAKKTFNKIARTYPYPCDIESERGLIATADSRAAKKQ